MAEISAFPLNWPNTMPRNKNREKGQFRTSLAGALKNVDTSLRAFGRESGKPISDLVISSNVTLGVTKPNDPGVAIWFRWDGEMRCIPVDRYQTVEANLQAIFHVLEARRTELRHGTLALVRATFQGFKALPSPEKRSWHAVLGLEPGRRWEPETIEERYRLLAKKHHPDAPGGSHEAMAELNQARVDALAEFGDA
ncbi:J domain-containing protein [Brucella intermedia]|uniref:Heat shock protein DnaJ domain-containing protein n=1 Tax=Brucella intermedia M86 TaxID=1234597 RepID=M5JL54_9HYPH|nr:J domain-containing protein [Brucella intermedia]ELT47405.1 heat shock protein DnaJ domain-containing protein [Brucella intermedia M86]